VATRARSVPALPTATFMFTDLAGSLKIKAEYGMRVFAELLARHDSLFRSIIESIPGAEIRQDLGDGFYASFVTAADAVAAGLRFQIGLKEGTWDPQPLGVRIGIHLGRMQQLSTAGTATQTGLVGSTADIAARVMSLAMPGQVLMTRAVFDEARPYVRSIPGGTPGEAAILPQWLAHGRYWLKGQEEPIELFEVGLPGISPLIPPPESGKGERYLAADDTVVDRTKPPTAEEVKRLPRWARVAFAARCARRAMPLFELSGGVTRDLSPVNAAIAAAEDFASAARSAPGVFDNDAEDGAEKAARAAKIAEGDKRAHAAARSACSAAWAAYEGASRSSAHQQAANAVHFAVEAIPSGLSQVWADYDRVTELAIDQVWTDATPVPPSVFGPMWPSGEPEWVRGPTSLDPPHDRSKPPTANDLKRLPRWFRVAFASRCARRVQPLFVRWCQGQRLLAAVDRAISAAESASRYAMEASAGDAIRLADTASDAARADADGSSGAARSTARAANRAAAAAADAADAAQSASAATRTVVDAAGGAAANASYAADVAYRGESPIRGDGDSITLAHLWRDFDRLIELASVTPATDSTPVPPDAFGPMWPDGEPEWAKPAVVGEGPLPEPRIAVVWDPEVVTEDEYAELIDILGDTVRANGGIGVERIKDLGCEVTAGVGVPHA
jgi:class 3 adenylate cyclase